MIRRPPRSTQSRSSAASDVYKRQGGEGAIVSIDGTQSTPLSNDGTVNIYDLDSVDWLNYGQAYHITGVDWAMEDWEP